MMDRALRTSLTMVLVIVALGLAGSALAEPRPEPGAGQGPLSEDMVFVKGGCFEMGDDSVDDPFDVGFGGIDNKKPMHTVCVGDFYIGRYEVTQRQWTEVMGKNPSYHKPCDDCPVETVNWYDVQDFLERLGRKDGGEYRLPTEAEWEYAATSGGKRERFPGTSNDSELGDYAWHMGNSDFVAHPVGRKKPNGLGLYDMGGNVWEWVEDWYEWNYYKTSPKDKPMGPLTGEYRVIRGGAWSCDWKVQRTVARGWGDPEDKDSMRGFRAVRDK